VLPPQLALDCAGAGEGTLASAVSNLCSTKPHFYLPKHVSFILAYVLCCLTWLTWYLGLRCKFKAYLLW